MGKPGSRRFPVTVTHLPVTRCQICHRTMAYRPGKASDALTGHYRQAHPASPPPGSRHTQIARRPRRPLPGRGQPARQDHATDPSGHRPQPAHGEGTRDIRPGAARAPCRGDQLGCAHQADLMHQIASRPCQETSGSADERLLLKGQSGWCVFREKLPARAPRHASLVTRADHRAAFRQRDGYLTAHGRRAAAPYLSGLAWRPRR